MRERERENFAHTGVAISPFGYSVATVNMRHITASIAPTLRFRLGLLRFGISGVWGNPAGAAGARGRAGAPGKASSQAGRTRVTTLHSAPQHGDKSIRRCITARRAWRIVHTHVNERHTARRLVV